ncbi:hypothetical protein AAON49_02995 [Pseudotenacibaculum sp. MALMAid0570]|uniref:hypothetical protein n=1 Tax=Pseudotenacibaculum sp. MALMAid0570 TaxID=3143938 RepID=UPI0032DE7AE5
MKNFRLLFFSIGFLAFLVFLMLNLYIDESSLNVLRYKGMNTTISHVLSGEYPYTTFLDGKGDTTSNLPGLFYLGMPFYLLGDVGYLQVFVFMLILLFLYKLEISNYRKIGVLCLLLMCPAFLWEVFVKSDLMSNVFLLSFFMYWWSKKNEENYFEKPVLLAFLIALFLLTRLIVVMPLIIMFFMPFMKAQMKNKLIFIIALVSFIFLISLPVLITIPSWEIFLQYNPLNNQTGEAPWFLSAFFLTLSFLLSKRFNAPNKIFFVLSLLVFSLVLVRFLLNGFEEGFYRNIFLNLFDISYFGLTIPFLFFYAIQQKNIMHA